MASNVTKSGQQILVAIDKWLSKELKSIRLAEGQMGKEIQLPYAESWTSNREGDYCIVTIGNDKYKCTDTSYWQLRKGIASHVIDAVNKANQKRSKNVIVAEKEIETYNETSNWWNASEFTDVKSVYLVPKPCKEYTQLQKWLAKYGNFELKDYELYSVRLFGKRGRYDESGMRMFLCHEPTRCKKALEMLRKERTTGCTLSVKVTNEDDGNYDESVRYETEYYGQRVRMLDVAIYTKSGKQKTSVMVY